MTEVRFTQPGTLSRRGMERMNTDLPPYLSVHSKCCEDMYSEKNPNGYINLGVAEDFVSFRFLEKVLREKIQEDLPDSVAGYESIGGLPSFRSSLSDFLSRRVFGRREVSPDTLICTSGVGSAIELLMFALCDPGDGVIIPTPAYPGFDNDLCTRVNCLPVYAIHPPADYFDLKVRILEETRRKAEKDGVNVRAIIISSPTNPTGRIVQPQTLKQVINWAREHRLHVISDEIYALSTFVDGESFVSVNDRRITPHGLGNYVHVLWGFSKDFSINGLRCGVLLTENVAVYECICSLTYFCSTSSLAQVALERVISDDETSNLFLERRRERLRSAYELVVTELEKFSITVVPANSGMFVVADLRQFLSGLEFQDERDLWKGILEEAKVNFLPGESCHTYEPGWFRICFTAVNENTLRVAVNRVGNYLLQKKQLQ